MKKLMGYDQRLRGFITYWSDLVVNVSLTAVFNLFLKKKKKKKPFKPF